jgi:low temperature requirement protein LtrA
MRISPPPLRTADGHHRDKRWPSWVELFFDLVFAGAASQLATALLDHLTLSTLVRFNVLFLMVWWLWAQFSFYADRHESDSAAYLSAFLAAAVLCVGLAASAPRAVAGQADGFIISVAGLRALQLLLYAQARRHIPATRALYSRYLICFGAGGALWLSSLATAGQPRYALWAAAIAVDGLGEMAMLSPSRWVPLNTWHLAERFQKFVLIVLGLSVAGLISAATLRRWSVPLALVLAAAVVTLTALWWAWIRAADRYALHGPREIVRFAVANLPIVAGIAASGAGLHQAILAADTTHIISIGPRAALYGGVSVYLAASFLMPASKPIPRVRAARLVTAAAIMCLVGTGAVVPPVYQIPALALLLTVGLVAEVRLDHRAGFNRSWDSGPIDVRYRWKRTEPQERHPWPDQVRPSPARRGRPGRRRTAWQVAWASVPVAVIVAVAAGALVMVTGKSNDALAQRADQSPATRGVMSGAATKGAGAAGPLAAGQSASTFPGYPGQHGTATVNSIASDGSVQIAVGSADGHAAIWRRDGGGPWTLFTSSSVISRTVGATLTSVTHGPAGWLAVGNIMPGGSSATGGPDTSPAALWPLVFTSWSSLHWRSATGAAVLSVPGVTMGAAAANASGYVVVGSQFTNGVPVDAMWWSTDLKNWYRGGDTIMSTTSSLSSGLPDSQIFAVSATPGGFIAVGSHNGCHTAWLTADGQHWLSYDVPKPRGTLTPMLRQVAVVGNLVVATGDIGADGGRYPVAVVSQDGGVHWEASSLGTTATFSGPQGTVTALTPDGSGFLAAGLFGPPGAQQAVTWTSPDGVTWSPALPAGSGTRQITALSSAGHSVISISSLTSQYGDRAVEETAPAP